jgi:uncharacterized membrane protein YgcG
MRRSRVILSGALALLASAGTPLRAQTTPKIELEFGYECGDRFIVRNDGSQPVLVEYAAAGMQDRSQLHLSGKQSVEVASAQDGNLELWVGGKLVASEPKGDRPCTGTTQPSGSAQHSDSTQHSDTGLVRPADPPQPPDSAAQSDSTTKHVPTVFNYAPPTDCVLNPPPLRDPFHPYYYAPGAGAIPSGGPSGGAIGRSVSGGKGSGGSSGSSGSSGGRGHR